MISMRSPSDRLPADLAIYVIDVAGGEKIPSKGGPGITRSDLLVINKIDLAPHVGASLEMMERDSRRMRGERPFVFTNLRSGDGCDLIARFLKTRAGSMRTAEAPDPAAGLFVGEPTCSRFAPGQHSSEYDEAQDDRCHDNGIFNRHCLLLTTALSVSNS